MKKIHIFTTYYFLDMENDNKSLDILGIKPISNALDTTVTKTFAGIEAFLKSVCEPALEEVGLMLRDKFRYWRLNNILKMLEKAEGKLHFDGTDLKIHAHPRVALAIIENSSLNDNNEIQELWAGLFASSCTLTGQDDENLIFVDLLKQLTTVEAKILEYACKNSQKILFKNGLIMGKDLNVTFAFLTQLTGVNDVYRIDRELDHLRSLELLGQDGGFLAEGQELIADISASALALNLYVRCQGSLLSVAEFWKESLITQE